MASNVISINFVLIFIKIRLLIQMPLRTDAHIAFKQNKFVKIYLQNKEGR
jgi:hypothetical protein